MTDTQIEQVIQAKGLTAPRITPADIEANIASEHYFTAAEGVHGAFDVKNRPFGSEISSGDDLMDAANPPAGLHLVTICTLILNNGCKVVGVNEGPVSPENFDQFIGRSLARQKAVDQIWPMLGYALRERLHRQSAQPCTCHLHENAGCTNCPTTKE